MLKELSAKNFAIIDSIHVEFDSGLSILTGETGAGKSILIDALEMGLGKRARDGLIRSGTDMLQVSLAFDIAHIEVAQRWLSDNGLDAEEKDTCIMRRTYRKDGRSQAYINGSPVNLGQLKDLGALIVDIVGQNTHQHLLHKEHQLWLLDVRCGHSAEVKKIRSVYRDWKRIDEEIIECEENMRDKEVRKKVLGEQLVELEECDIHAGEYEDVEQQHRNLAQGEKFKDALVLAYDTLDGENDSAVERLGKVGIALNKITEGNPQIDSARQLIDTALAQINEASGELYACLEAMNSGGQDFEQLEQRLRQLSELAKRHYVQPQMLLDITQQIRAKIENLDHSESHLQGLKEQRKAFATTYQHLAKTISKKRHSAAQQIEKDVVETLNKLNMPNAKFKVVLNVDDTSPAANGYDQVQFMVQTNPGQPLQALQTASGGELSRISLALQMALAKYRTTPVLLFDEVDSGVGGATAQAVGELLKSISHNAQVFCVTHLSQVASYASHHYRVSKAPIDNETRISIELLDEGQRHREIARMVAGAEITKQSLKYAQEMIEKAGALIH